MNLIFFVLFTLFNFTNAFFSKTHQFLGNIYEDYLHKNNITQFFLIKNSTNINNFREASVWADQIKRNKNYTWSHNLHYIDINTCDNIILNKEIVYNYCNENCIITAILNKTNDLKDNYNKNKYTNVFENSENFKFLIHFLQDFVQPLHTIGFYRGGNDDRITLVKDNRYIFTNMHSLWDSYLPEYYINYEFDLKDILSDIYYQSISTIYDYENFLLFNLNKIYNIACHNAHLHDKTINFIEYYNKNNQNLKEMFIIYINLVINTFNYIYN